MSEALPGAKTREETPGVVRGEVRAACGTLRDHWPGILLFAFVITFLTCRASVLLSSAEFALLDVWLRDRPPRAPDPRIVLVGINKSDVEFHSNNRFRTKCGCESVPRSEIGRLISRLKDAGAQAVAVDIIFNQACGVQGHDEWLRKALGEPGEGVLVADARPTPDLDEYTDPPQQLMPETPPLIAAPLLYQPHGVIRAVRLYQEGQTVRRNGLRETTQYPPLAAVVYCVVAGHPQELPEALADEAVRCAELRVPVWAAESIYLFSPIMPRPTDPAAQSKHAMLINWAGPTGTFPTYWHAEVLKASRKTLARRFAGKVVLIGSMYDRKKTPVGQEARKAPGPMLNQGNERSMSGVEAHANALDTLLQQRFIRPIPTPAAWLLIFGSVLLTALVFRSLATWRAVLMTVVEVVSLFGVAHIAIVYDVWVYSVIPTAAIAVSGVVTAVWCYANSRQQTVELQRAVKARDSATTVLVHDLKQPLAAIAALAAAIRAQQQADPTVVPPDLLERIEQQVENALGEIDELLLIGPDRELTLRRSRFDIAALAADLAVAQSMKSPLHEVEVHAPVGGVFISADGRYIGRALNNLMDNAIKYWPEGGTVSVDVEPAPRTVLVRVIDQGLGMNPEQQSRIFTEFERAIPEGMNIPGTGIGLYSTKRIVEAHGGTVSVESEPGVGSVFTLAIPYVSESASNTQGGSSDENT